MVASPVSSTTCSRPCTTHLASDSRHHRSACSGRIFVYDDQDGRAGVLINPEIRETRGEWEHQEGCLSIPGLYFDIVRPKEILLVGHDLDGNEVQIEADEMVSRIFQHELDHLDGVLMVERLDEDQRKQAKKAVRELQLQRAAAREATDAGGLRLP